jgi:hypothetical protein
MMVLLIVLVAAGNSCCWGHVVGERAAGTWNVCRKQLALHAATRKRGRTCCM